MLQYTKVKTRVKTLASIWGTVLLTLGLVYWLFLAPQHNSVYYAVPEACNAVHLGMNLQQAQIAMEAKAYPFGEALVGDKGDKLVNGNCEIEFNNGKVTHVDTTHNMVGDY